MLALCIFLLFAFALAQLAQTFGPARPVFAPARAGGARVGLLVAG